MAAVMAAGLLSASCNDDAGGNGNNGTTEGQYVVAATIDDANYLLSTTTIESGSINAQNNGTVAAEASQWVFWGTDYLYRLVYNQGSAAVTSSFIRDANGNITERTRTYEVRRYTSYGVYGDYIMTSSSNDGPEELAIEGGYLPKVFDINYLHVKNETLSTNSETLISENFLGTGEYVMLAGFEQVGDKLYSAVIPMGLSQYGNYSNDGGWILPGNEDLVKTESGGSNSSSYQAGELQWTQYPDSCWVAIFDDETLTSYTIARTDKLSYACGRNRSAYYQTFWQADDGMVYVFSPSYAKTMSDTRQQTKHDASVARIDPSTGEFDDYYCNIEEQSGGRSFMRCWHAGGNSFLLLMYDNPFSSGSYTACDLAIYDADAMKLTFVDGIPSADVISGFGSTVYVEGNKVYVSIVTTNEQPTIYGIDVTTAQATAGLSVQCESIGCVGVLTQQS